VFLTYHSQAVTNFVALFWISWFLLIWLSQAKPQIWHPYPHFFQIRAIIIF